MEKRIRGYIKTWEGRCYPDGIPDEVPQEIADKVPTYKRICLAILTNDVALESLGYQPPKSAVYHAIKHEEIKNRKNMPVKKDLREILTTLESECYKTLEKYPDGFLRNYTTTLFRLQDSQINPIINIPRKTVQSVIDKGYSELLPGHKFKLI